MGCDTESGGLTPKKKVVEEVNANWTIDVSDTVTKDYQGLPVNYTLTYKASKNGGTRPQGTYKGTALLKMEADFSKIPGLQNPAIKFEGNIDGQFEDPKVEIALGWTTKNEADDYGLAPLVPSENDGESEPQPAPLTPPDGDPDLIYIGKSTLKLSGNGTLNIMAEGIGGEKANYDDSAQSSHSLPYTLIVTDATVEIQLQDIGTFKGTVTGEPIK